jgi:hypothetical protein
VLRRGRRASGVVEVVVGWCRWLWWCGYVVFSGRIIVVVVVVVGGHPGEIIRGLLVWRRRS